MSGQLFDVYFCWMNRHWRSRARELALKVQDARGCRRIEGVAVVEDDVDVDADMELLNDVETKESTSFV